MRDSKVAITYLDRRFTDNGTLYVKVCSSRNVQRVLETLDKHLHEVVMVVNAEPGEVSRRCKHQP